jgi:small nuclear ribonucleoprotein (snRNP)-like protein
VVDVQLQSGVTYQGVLKAVSPKLSVALALAHDKSKDPTSQNTERLMQLEFADVVSVSVQPDANPNDTSRLFYPPTPLLSMWFTTDIFKTDTEIGRANGSGFTKELQVGYYTCSMV